MTKKQVNELEHGLYRIYWQERQGGGSSLAAVGSTPDGRRWMAPTNWIGIDSETTPTHWRHVARVDLILPNATADRQSEAGERGGIMNEAKTASGCTGPSDCSGYRELTDEEASARAIEMGAIDWAQFGGDPYAPNAIADRPAKAGERNSI